MTGYIFDVMEDEKFDQQALENRRRFYEEESFNTFFEEQKAKHPDIMADHQSEIDKDIEAKKKEYPDVVSESELPEASVSRVVKSGLKSLIESPRDFSAAIRATLEQGRINVQSDPDYKYPFASELFDRWIGKLERFEEDFRYKGEEDFSVSSGYAEDVSRGIGGSLFSTMSMMLAPIIGPGAALPMVVQLKGASYRNFEERVRNKYSREIASGIMTEDEIKQVANKAANWSAGLQAPLEALGDVFKIRAAFGKKTFTKIVTGIGESMLGEGVTELLQQYPEEFATIMVLNKDLTFEEQWEYFKLSADKGMFKRALYAGSVGAGAGGVTTGAIIMPMSATATGEKYVETHGGSSLFMSPKQRKINEEKVKRAKEAFEDNKVLELKDRYKTLGEEIHNLEIEKIPDEEKIEILMNEREEIASKISPDSKAYDIAMEEEQDIKKKEAVLADSIKDVVGMTDKPIVEEVTKKNEEGVLITQKEYIDPHGEDITEKKFQEGETILTIKDRDVKDGNVKKFKFNFNQVQDGKDVDKLFDLVLKNIKESNIAELNIDEQTRGIITNKQTELLAQDLDMSVDDLLSRKVGEAFNAEQALAARQILEKSTDRILKLAEIVSKVGVHNQKDTFEFVKSLHLHAAIEAQVLGMRAEAGRALQSFGIELGNEAFMLKQINDLVDQSAGTAKDLADAILRRKEAVSARVLTKEITRLMRGFTESKNRHGFLVWFKNSLLASPDTHLRNFLVNFGTSITTPLEHIVAAGVGKFSKASDIRDYNKKLESGELGILNAELTRTEKYIEEENNEYKLTKETSRQDIETDLTRRGVSEQNKKKDLQMWEKNYNKTEEAKNSQKKINSLQQKQERLERELKKPENYHYISFKQAGGMAWASFTGWMDGFKILADVLPSVIAMKGIPEQHKKINKKIELGNDKVGPIWEFINLPGTMMEVGDLFFSTGVHKNMNLYIVAQRRVAEMTEKRNLSLKQSAKVYSKLIEQYRKVEEATASERRTDSTLNMDLYSEVQNEVEYQLFRQPLEGLGKNIHNVIRQSPGKILEWLVPFFRTPWNILQYAVERAPGLQLVQNKFRNDMESSDPAIRDLAKAKVAISSAVTVAVLYNYFIGNLTGRGPSDDDERTQLYNQGWQPYSFLINGNYYSYQNFEPVGFTVGMIADTAEILGEINDPDRAKLLGAVMFSLMNNITDKTFLSNVTDMFVALDEQDRYGDTFIAKKLTGLLPFKGSLSYAKDIVDPTYRITNEMGSEREEPFLPNTGQFEKFVFQLINEVRNTTPGFSDAVDINGEPILQPVLNVWGEERDKSYAYPVAVGVEHLLELEEEMPKGIRWLGKSPIKKSEKKYSPVDYELMRLQMGIEMPRKVPVIREVKTPLRADEYNMYIRLINNKDRNGNPIGGKPTLKGRLDKLINLQYYNDLSNEDQKQEINSVVERARADARVALYELNKNVREYVDTHPPE